MKLDIRSALVGVVVGAAVMILVGARAGQVEAQHSINTYEQTPQFAPISPPPYAFQIGSNNDVYVMDGNCGAVRRVFQRNGRWASELVAPVPSEYLPRPATRQR